MAPAGTPSEPENAPNAPNPPTAPFAPYVSRDGTRLTTVYATSWTYAPGGTADGDGGPSHPSGLLKLGRLATFYEQHADQLPQVLLRERLDPTAVVPDRWSATAEATGVTAATLWYLTAPSGQILLALTFDVDAPLIACIPLLEDLYYADLTCDGVGLEQLAASRVGATTPGLLQERHQLVFRASPTTADVPSADTVQRVIYRADLPARPEHSSICLPDELNRRPTTTGALGPYASLLTGHQDYVENAAFLSVVQAVASAARLREIQVLADSYTRHFRNRSDGGARPHERRTLLEHITDALGHLELELGYSVETPADLATLIPSLRPTAYHTALYEAMGVTERAAKISKGLSRLANSAAAELTSIQSTEQRSADRRRVRTVAAVTFVTTVTATLGLLFAFFGVNSSEVDAHRSMFDHTYTPVYAVIASVLVLAFALYATLQAVDRAALRRDRAPLPTWHGTHRLLAHELGGSILDGTPLSTSLPPVPAPRPTPPPPPSPPPARQSAER
ncbi:hypothetical protein OG762_35740 [Streptomyces sp. NBC_01136]|uniref:hypothetical protein n=1 Tax=unclassified Streptomyces TaxID=2593676 RepID=UPI0032493009|nr:hypothetical protein OG762_35740 [Streptomyces sp. NBC_01136]